MFMFLLRKNLYLYLRVMEAQKVIKLNPKQQQIFNLLKAYRDQLKLKTVLRVAGGWVRDKIMGKESHDIDIALDDMKGQQFVTLIKQCASKNHQKISGFGVTKFNPEMSKHLQTATAKIHDHWIDFVNLRSEKYGQDSRIPIIDIGTPKQDAERRDFTINSMFYNLDTQKIEDWTGLGLSDLENKILRTPLKPFETFKDDPLRVMRCLRFKSRFQFNVEPAIYQALKQEQIRVALLKKVSKERVGTELAGILKAKNTLSGLIDIKDYRLWNIIFQLPKDTNFIDQQAIQRIPDQSFSLVQRFMLSLQKNNWLTEKYFYNPQQGQINKKGKKNKVISYQSDQLRVIVLLSVLTRVYYPFQVKLGKSKANLTQYMIKDQLKYPQKYSKFAYHLNQGVNRLSKINPQNIYQLIRWLRFSQEKWELMIHLCWASYQVQLIKPKFNPFQIREAILTKKLDRAYLVQPPVDGTFITKKGIKGPVIGRVLENATIWQIMNPNKKEGDFVQQFQVNPEFFMSENTYK